MPLHPNEEDHYKHGAQVFIGTRYDGAQTCSALVNEGEVIYIGKSGGYKDSSMTAKQAGRQRILEAAEEIGSKMMELGVKKYLLNVGYRVRMTNYTVDEFDCESISNILRDEFKAVIDARIA